MKVPENLLYTKEHEWISEDGSTVKVGITDFAQSQLGDIIFLELPEVGDQIVAGESFGEIEAVKTVSELYAPINGTILEVNEDLEESPENINQDCYGSGWIIKVSKDGDLESEGLIDNKAYSNLIE